MKGIQFIIIYILTLAAVLVGADHAWALQSHGAPEGEYVHQMAHLLFMASLAYLFWHTRREQELREKGWKYLQIFCVLFFCWNLPAFSGHEIIKYLDDSDFFYRNTIQGRIAPPFSIIKLLHYVTKMDHFLFTPGLLALVISLRCFYTEAKKGGDQ